MGSGPPAAHVMPLGSVRVGFAAGGPVLMGRLGRPAPWSRGRRSSTSSSSWRSAGERARDAVEQVHRAVGWSGCAARWRAGEGPPELQSRR